MCEVLSNGMSGHCDNKADAEQLQQSFCFMCLCVQVSSWQLTHTLELVGWSGEQQLALHTARPGTAGDTGLLIAALHPV